MRDIVLAPIILAIAAYGLLHPWLGILGWTWVSIMNPHAFSWRLSTMPIAALIGGATLLGLLITKDRRKFVLEPESIVLVIFMLWMTITMVLAFRPSDSYVMWNRVMKIDLMILVAMVVLHSKKHIMLLAWVLVFSIGFFGVKGGMFTLATGGSYRVWGPENSYIEGNNEIALALVMIIPIMRFLQLTSDSKWIKRGFGASMVLCAAAALGSHSRGALLAIVAMAIVLWWRGKNRIVGLVLLPVLGIALASFMPAEWWDRMGTIQTYEEDASAGGRINAWWMAWNVAKDNVFGGGFAFMSRPVCAVYAPIPDDCRAAHSIYFMVLGEHGFVGLFLFLLLWTMVYVSAGRLRRQGNKQPETQWLSHMGAMCQVSLVGYAVGGAFLSLSYYDLPYNILILVVLGRRWMQGKEWVVEAAQQAAESAAREAKNARLAGR